MRKITIPTQGLSTCPRVCNGNTKSQEMIAVARSAIPTRLAQCRVTKNSVGLSVASFIACNDKNSQRVRRVQVTPPGISHWHY